MKRLLPFLLCLLLLFGCSGVPENAYHNANFTAELPESFEPVSDAPIVCFAPYGNALLSSSITFSSTELNWYFDRFTEEEYAEALQTMTGYDSLTVERVESCKVDGCDARRIACKVSIDQGVHDLIVYAVSADQIFFFTLLNRDTDHYVEAFDEMMRSLRFTEES